MNYLGITSKSLFNSICESERQANEFRPPQDAEVCSAGHRDERCIQVGRYGRGGVTPAVGCAHKSRTIILDLF